MSKLIDNLLNRRGLVHESMNDDEFVTAVETKIVLLDNVVDSLHIEAWDVSCEANNALVIEQDKKKDNEKFG